MSVTVTDLFCGAGGSSTGLVEAGFELTLAANHSPIAIETHAANHPTAEHLCADVNNYDMRRLPRTDVLWASPICTEISPAGGRRRASGQEPLPLEEFGAIDRGVFDRTRATAYDVIRAAEVHRYKVVIVENVVEFATDWPLYPWWRQGMHHIGYDSQVVSVSAAHIGGEGNDPAAQWRCRKFTVFTLEGIRRPDLTPRPLAWCRACEADTYAVQSWRNGRTIGKYKQQYDYRCERTACGHAIVDPYVRPAADIIDWTNLGTRIGDRKRPLAETTMSRIRAGLELIPDRPSIITVNHGGHDGRAVPADAAPLASRTVRIGDGILVPAGGTWNTRPTTVAEPMRTRLANPRGYESLVTLPEAGDPFIVEYRNHATASPVSAPLGTITAGGNHHALVVPYRNAATKTTAEPLHTLGTVDSAALVRTAVDVEDCRLRMIQPAEQMAAQRFPATYRMCGTKGEQTAQAGNAVPVNVAHWIGQRVLEVL